MQAVRCPSNAFRYNGTLCSCDPGHVFNFSSNSCDLFADSGLAVVLSSGVNYDFTVPFPGTIFSFDSIKKFTQSQAVFLEATLVILLCWLGFCFILRLFPLGSDGRSSWFKIRWWISRLDISFATSHWLHDQKPVIKRKTELGGTFSIASWILFVGLLAALLYQIISKRTVEVHNVRATNAPDLVSFMNDLEFNITTVSSMSCAQLRGLGTLVTGSPAFVDNRVVPLSTIANYSCVNTSAGPTISLRCKNCVLIRDFACVSWQFIDLPNNPATAAGFMFNVTAKNQAAKKHLSFVSGTLKNASDFDNRPITFRGAVSNVIKFNLFPKIYHNIHDLRLIQPLFHEFLPGSYFDEANQLQASLESSDSGFINTTLFINFLSSYIVEIDNQNILGPVSFLADLGGLYCISIGIFFYILVQCEYRIKRLRKEDSTMRKIRNRKKAKEHWEKLRKYVKFTWAPTLLDNNRNETTSTTCCSDVMTKSFRRSESRRKRKLSNITDAVSFNKRISTPAEKEVLHLENVEPINAGPIFCSHLGGACQNQKIPVINIANLPPLPPFDFMDKKEINMMDLQKNIQNLYIYNVMLREKLIEAQSMATSTRHERE